MLPLHIHSNYSLLSGALTVEEIVAHAKKIGSRYVSLTDTDGMYGLIKLAKLAGEERLKPIFGAMISNPQNENEYAIFLAKNNPGYSELCGIITSRKLKENFSLIETIHGTSNNLFIITPSVSLISNLNIDSKLKKNLFVELISTEAQRKKSKELYEYAQKEGLQIIASQPVYFSNSDNYLIHKTLTAIRLNSTLENLSSEESMDPEFHFILPEDFSEKWSQLPDALWNLNYVVQNCNVNLKVNNYKHPNFPLQKNETPFSLLWKTAFEGLAERYQPITDKAVKRLQYELEVIDELGFCDYFLIVGDIIRESRKRKILTIGRGSAANSLVSYCLGFTQIDPLEHNLYFERFLNRGRISPPDVDLDFSWKERDEIIKYVFEKYGYDHVAMISTHVTFRARSAFRETAKVFGLSNHEISKFSKFIPWTSAQNLTNLAEKFPEAKSLRFNDDPWKSIIETASKIGGFPRHLSIHPSGIVITDRQITKYTALEFAANKGLGLIVTQPDMYSLEDLGLIKIDLLSQRSLGVLRDTLSKLSAKSSNKINIPHVFPIENHTE